MNFRRIFHLTGLVLLIEAGLLLIPLFTAFIYHESVVPYLITICVAAAVGVGFVSIPVHSDHFVSRDGYVLVTFSWILMIAVGIIPFLLCDGGVSNVADAIFETASGFTTTGATIFTDVEKIPYGLLMWRALTQWIGGMGVLVFLLALLPKSSGSNVHIMRAEMPGPTVEKLVPKTRNTALWLYGMYIILTVSEIVLLICGGMPLFDAIVNSFATASTGGFSMKADGIFSYGAYAEIVITVFMVLFGVNFSVFFLLLFRKFKEAFKNEELIAFIIIYCVATVSIFLNIRSMYSGGDSLRHAAFQTASIMTTTGFSTADTNLWPTFSKAILMFLTITGACAGSTAGGVKVSRVLIMGKSVLYEVRQLVRPRTVQSIKQDSKSLNSTVVHSTYLFFYAYILIVMLTVVCVSLDGYDFETTFSATIACMGDVGPGFGLVGTMGSYNIFSAANKIVLSVAMLLGRLEIIPVLVFLSPSAYHQK